MPRNTTFSNTANQDIVPKVNKDPFYRTNDILNGVFKKQIKLERGEKNCTDLKTIWVNFNEVRLQPIVDKLGQKDSREHYLLSCGHAWDSEKDFQLGHYIPCWPCGNAEAYKGFEHEWEHIVFKSNLCARAAFVDQYAQNLLVQAPHVNVEELKNFLHLFINAFDDIRVNSLQERVYPGSAHQLWARWERLLKQGGYYDQVFLAFAMAIGLKMEVDPAGPFYALRPIIEWGMAKARYRTFGRMLLDVRVVIDRCLGAILSHISPPPQQHDQSAEPPQSTDPQQSQSPQSPPPEQHAGNQDGQSDDGDAEEDTSQAGAAQRINKAGSSSQGDPDPGQRSSDVVPGQESRSSSAGSPKPPSHIPSSSQVSATEAERSQALTQLMDGAGVIDPKEEHPILSQAQRDADPSSQSTKTLVVQLLAEDIEDLDAIDADQPADVPDEDMQKQLNALALQAGLGPGKSKDSHLKSEAKAKITFIDVQPYNIDEKKYVVLADVEESSVKRIRSIFFRELGKRKAARNISGPAVDIPAFIQFKMDRRDPEVFEGEALNRGFAYHVLADMSGSMSRLFPVVGRAMVMLRDALDFPFVRGGFWGFRGGQSAATGEVWVYRYDRECQGFEGRTAITLSNGSKLQMPVECGSITPMNSALHVAIRNVDRHVPAGMAKRLYLLTDGQPFQMRTDGQMISYRYLKQFVSQEIRWARAHGIDVYTVIIGPAIPDDEARYMFGNDRYWMRASSAKAAPDSIDVVLSKLVIQNFTKYLRAR